MIAHVQETDPILVGGDFNFVFHSKFDITGEQSLQSSQNGRK